MKKAITEALEHHKNLLYQNTAMALDLICETLFYKYGFNALWQGKSIYIEEKRVASIETYKEAKDIIGIYRYKVLI